MRAGNLRHYVAFQSSVDTPDGSGGMVEVWAADFYDWVAIWPMSGKEMIENLRVSADITHKVRMRYRSGVTNKMRIVWGSRTLEIKTAPINKDERNYQVDLICAELDVS